MKKKKIFQRTIDQWGVQPQLIMFVEESSELNKEISKYLRGKDNLKEISEEIVDCQIMLDQLIHIFNFDDKLLKEIRKQKIERIERRLEKDDQNYR